MGTTVLIPCKILICRFCTARVFTEIEPPFKWYRCSGCYARSGHYDLDKRTQLVTNPDYRLGLIAPLEDFDG